MRSFILGKRGVSVKQSYDSILYTKSNLVFRRRNHSNVWKQPNSVEASLQVGDSNLVIQSGKLARFADGCATVQCGDTCVMVTAVSARQSLQSQSFMPLTVDYRQKAAAAGRIPMNHLRREMGPTDRETLTGRMIDRSIRPMFPAGYYNNTQIAANLLSVDGANDPDVLAINAASTALSLSDIPWHGPVGAVRVGYLNDEIVLNPTRKQLQKSLVNLVVSGVKGKKVAMLEASAENVSDAIFRQCLCEGVEATERIVEVITELQESKGTPKRPVQPIVKLKQDIMMYMKDLAEFEVKAIYTDYTHHKISRDTAIWSLRDEVVAKMLKTCEDIEPKVLHEAFSEIIKNIFRNLIFENNLRCDGRELSQLRDISCEVDLYKPLHGSSLFQRGQTQVLCTLAFDSPDSAIKVDTISSLMSGMKEKNFFLHYEFPPYATNETGRMGIGRRELGHGALAEKALRPVVPSDCPFTIRLSAEVLESNGSSSMASVCAGSLALMDAGVKINEPVAGVAMGVVTKTDAKTGKVIEHRILTDLLGIEDYMGDMDFKLAGTSNGVTALQADIKPMGLPLNIILEAFDRGTVAKGMILDIMHNTIEAPRESYKDNSPVVKEITVRPEQVPRLLGTGGVNLKRLQADTGVNVSAVADGKYSLFAPNREAYEEAKETIDGLLSQDPEMQLDFGGVYVAVVTEIREYGVLVQLYPNMRPALIHNSQLDSRQIKHPSALGLEVGSKIKVKYLGRDPGNGALRLSRKILTVLTPRLTDMMKDV